MSKKILSLALVVVMLMSMFAFSTSAVDLSAGQIGIKIESDAVVGAPAGTIVTIKATVLIPEDEEVQLTFAPVSLGYDNTAYELVTEDSLAWGSSYEACFQNTSTTMAYNTTISNNIVKTFGDADKANGWNAGVQIKQTPISGGEFTTKTGYPVDPECELFTVKFRALKEIEAGSTIGAPVNGYGSNFFVFKLFSASTTAGTKVDAANVVLTDTYGVASSPVYKVGNAQYRPNGANYDLGVKFGFKTANIGIEFNEKGTSTNIASVGATLKVNGTPVAEPVESRFVYDVNGDNSEYQFRVVIEGVAADSTDKYEIATFVRYTNGTVRYADVVTINAADVIPG